MGCCYIALFAGGLQQGGYKSLSTSYGITKGLVHPDDGRAQ